MKRWKPLLGLAIALCLMGAGLGLIYLTSKAAVAYTLDWSVVGGGGNVSNQLSSTAGQSAAGWSTGAQQLGSGFWYGASVTITPNGTCPAPLPIACGQQVNGDTSTFTNNIDSYDCIHWNETGPEVIYEFTLKPGSNYTITAMLTNTGGIDLDIFLMAPAGCASGTCLDGDSFAPQVLVKENLAPGTYALSVDGADGAKGPYTLSLSCAGPKTPTFLPMILKNH